MNFYCYLDCIKEKEIKGLVYSESWLKYIDTIVVIDKKINVGDIIDFDGIKYAVRKISMYISANNNNSGDIYLQKLNTKE